MIPGYCTDEPWLKVLYNKFISTEITNDKCYI